MQKHELLVECMDRRANFRAMMLEAAMRSSHEGSDIYSYLTVVSRVHTEQWDKGFKQRHPKKRH